MTNSKKSPTQSVFSFGIASLAAILLGCTLAASAQAPVPDSPAIEAKAHAMVAKLTLEQKIELLGGVDGMFTHAEPSIGLDQWVRWLSTGPRHVLGLPQADPEQEGTWWDLDASWVPQDGNLASRSRNCPELGRTLLSRPLRLRRRGIDIPLPTPTPA